MKPFPAIDNFIRKIMAYTLYGIGNCGYAVYRKFMPWSSSVQGDNDDGPWKRKRKSK